MTNMEIAMEGKITEEFEAGLKPVLRVIGVETPTHPKRITWDASRVWHSNSGRKRGYFAQTAYGVTDADMRMDEEALSMSRIKTGRVQWPLIEGIEEGKPHSYKGAILPIARLEREVMVVCASCKMQHGPMADWLFGRMKREDDREPGKFRCECGGSKENQGTVMRPLLDKMSTAMRAAVENEDKKFRFPSFVGLFPTDSRPTEEVTLDEMETEVDDKLRFGQGLTVIGMSQLWDMYGGEDGWVEPIPNLIAVFGVSRTFEAGWLDDKLVPHDASRLGFQGFAGKPFYEPSPDRYRPRKGRRNDGSVRTV